MSRDGVHVKYNNEVAGDYDLRYSLGPKDVIESLQSLAARVNVKSLLEVGCGTGHWLSRMEKQYTAFGLDLSSAMLDKAGRKVSSSLCRGDALHLPYLAGSFDLVYCVHAVHHFISPSDFMEEAYRILRPGGILVLIGMDPYRKQDKWYVYDYFPETKKNDLMRYLSTADLMQCLQAGGFEQVKHLQGGRLDYDLTGDCVWSDPVLHKHGLSQLTLLTEKEYEAGMERIQDEILCSKRNGSDAVFSVHLQLPVVYGFKLCL